MKETQLFGALLPSNPEIQKILGAIREKYDIPEIEEGDDDLIELLQTEIDWDAVKVELDIDLQKINILPDEIMWLYPYINNPLDEAPQIPSIDGISPEINDQVQSFSNALFEKLGIPILLKISEYYQTMSNLLFEYLLTGKSRELPFNWFGEVLVTNIFGETLVIAMASQLSDPKEVARLFKEQYTRTFGKPQHKITRGLLNSADYLRMKWEGISIADIVDRYIQSHPSEFPRNPGTSAYRSAKRKKEAMMKKRLQRLEKIVYNRLGDKT